MTTPSWTDAEIENALTLIEKQSGRSRPQLLRDWILQELHLIPLFQETKLCKNSPNVPTLGRSNLV